MGGGRLVKTLEDIATNNGVLNFILFYGKKWRIEFMKNLQRSTINFVTKQK